MVKHIVFWKLKEQVANSDKANNAKLIKEKMEALNGKIEGLIRLELGIDFLGEENYNLALYAELKDKEALTYYQEHPLHQAIAPLVRELVTNRIAVDYEIL